MKPFLSKRDIKTALAVCLSIFIAHILKLKYPFFTAIATIFSMENTIANTFKAGLLRMLGTVIGAGAGVLFVVIKPNNPILSGIGMLLLIFVCNLIRSYRAIPIAGVVFVAIMLGTDIKNPLFYSLMRVFDTFIGIVVAVAVNYLVFPPRELSEIEEGMKGITERILEAARRIICFKEDFNLKSLRSEIINSFNSFETYKAEFKHHQNKESQFSQIEKRMDIIRSILTHLKTVNDLKTTSILNKDNIRILKEIGLCSISQDGEPYGELNTVYNYHVAKVLNDLPKLIKLVFKGPSE